MPSFIKVHLRNAPDRDEFAKLVGQELYDHTREIDFPKVEDVVIDLAPVLDHDNQLLADAQAQWIQFCESHPFHPPVKLAQTQMAMLLAMYRLYQNIAPRLPLPAGGTDDVAARAKNQRGSRRKGIPCWLTDRHGIYEALTPPSVCIGARRLAHPAAPCKAANQGPCRRPGRLQK